MNINFYEPFLDRGTEHLSCQPLRQSLTKVEESKDDINAYLKRFERLNKPGMERKDMGNKSQVITNRKMVPDQAN